MGVYITVFQTITLDLRGKKSGKFLDYILQMGGSNLPSKEVVLTSSREIPKAKFQSTRNLPPIQLTLLNGLDGFDNGLHKEVYES